MKTTDNTLANCMLWMTDISVYRTRINKMLNQIQQQKNRFTMEGNYERFIELSQKIGAGIHRLQQIEIKVMHTLKKLTNELYKPTPVRWTSIENESELFDNMILANSLVVNLQKEIHQAFNPKRLIQKSESFIVDMPLGKRKKLFSKTSLQ